METLVIFAQFEIWFFLAILALLIGYQMLTGRINTKGLLHDKKDKKTGGISPGRVQLLVLTLAGAGYYLLLTIENGHPTEFPEVPEELLALVGGSNLVYLGSKVRSMLFR